MLKARWIIVHCHLFLEPCLPTGRRVPFALLKVILSLNLRLAIFLTSLPLHSICKKMHKKNVEKEPKFNPVENQENEGNIDINTDESLSGTSHLNEPVVEESELEKLKAELEDQKDKFVRKVAEFDNFRRRSAKERVELIQIGRA